VTSLTGEYFLGPLDRLIKGMDRGIAGGPFEKTVNVAPKHFSSASSPAAAGDLVLQYRKIGGFMCNLAAFDAERFARVRAMLGVAEPVMEPLQ
jgi:hypothetical protein